jgi:Domain of unknown function (DUF4226)
MAFIVGFVSVLDRLAEDLTATLSSVTGVRQFGPGTPAPPPLPDGPDNGGLLPPAEPYSPPPPESVAPPAGGGPMPRSTLDNLHGTDDAPYPMPTVQDPVALGPGLHWTEIAPGIWMPPGSANEPQSPPWQTHTMGWTGAAAEDARSADAALVQTARRRGDADQRLAQGMRGAGEAARSAQERLRTIQKDVEVGVAALRPSLDTPAGRQQLITLLDSKASEAREVIGQAQAAGAQAAAAMSAATGGYGSIAK